MGANWLLIVAIWFGFGNALKMPSLHSSRIKAAYQGVSGSNTAISALTYDRQAWINGFSTCEKETASVLEGSVPLDIEGTYFRNGHAKFTVGKEKVMHPFDADGMVAAVTIKDGKCTFRNRFVATDGYRKERRYKKILYRGAFGTKRQGGFFANAFDLKNKNVANTNVIWWAGRLLALWEGGLPHKLEPDSLRTLGDYRFKGMLKKSDTFSAHPRIDAKTGRMVNFSAKQGGNGPSTITVNEFAPGEVNVLKSRSFQIPSNLVFFHDFVVTDKYYVFNEAPITLNPLDFILGFKGPAECIKFDQTKPAVVHLVPRDPSDPLVRTIQLDPHFNFHFANAHDGPAGEVIFDVVKSDTLNLGDTSGSAEPVWVSIDYAKDVAYSKLWRYILKPLDSSASSFSFTKKELSPTQVEFPSVNPSVSCVPHRYIYASCGSDPASSTPVQGLIKIDTEAGSQVTWMPAPHEFLGESIFVARKHPAGSAPLPAEDDGYVFSFLFNGQSRSTEFVIFDAKNIPAGPVSRQGLPVMVPFGLHGSFAPGLTFDSDSVINRHKACLALESKQWGEMTGGFSGLGIVYDFKDY